MCQEKNMKQNLLEWRYKMNQNKIARSIALKEGGAKNLQIGDVKEVMKLFLQELAKHTDKDILKTVHRYK